jgi:hypothetical protein
MALVAQAAMDGTLNKGSIGRKYPTAGPNSSPSVSQSAPHG